MHLLCLFGLRQLEEKPLNRALFAPRDVEELLSLTLTTADADAGKGFGDVPKAAHLLAIDALMRTAVNSESVGRVMEHLLLSLALTPCSNDSVMASSSVAALARKLLKHGAVDVEDAMRRRTRTRCVDILVARQDSDVHLLALVASSLTGLCVGDALGCGELMDVVAKVALLGPMGGVRACALGILTNGDGVPDLSQQGMIWQTSFPRMLPGCSNWMCCCIVLRSERRFACGGCSGEHYCSNLCQKDDWQRRHSAVCRVPSSINH